MYLLQKHKIKKKVLKSKRKVKKTLLHFFIAYISIIILIITKKIKMQHNDITIKIGLILLPIVSFIADILFSTDKGLYLYKNSRDEGWMYVWRSMASSIIDT